MLKERLKLLFDADKNLSQIGLAAACKVAPPSINDWVSGKTTSIKGQNLLRAAKYLNVRPEWLAEGLGPMRHERSIEWDDILGYAQAAGLGDGAEASEYAETHKLKFRSDSLSRKRLLPHNLAVIYGRGESMLPRIHPGDAILFDTTDTEPKDEKLYVVHGPGPKGPEYSAKRCRDFDGMIFFDSLNPDGDHGWRKPRRMLDPKRPITIVGRIRWIGSWED